MNKNGLTLVELLAVIVVLAIVMGIAAVSVSYLIENSKQDVYKNYEENLESATKNYLTANLDKIPLPPDPNGTVYSTTINMETLLTNNFIDKLEDPKDRNNDCSESYVIVTRCEDKNNNYNLIYKVYLKCGENYETKHTDTYECND